MIDFLKGTVTRTDWAVNGGILVLAIGLGAAIVFLGVVGENDTREQLLEQIEVTGQKLAKTKETAENIEDLRQEEAKMKMLVDMFKRRLPTKQEISSLFRTFEEFEREIGRGLTVDKRAMPSKFDARKETIPYRMNASGSFHQIARFINRLERYERYFQISDLHIGPQEDGASQARFVLSTYRFIEEEEDEEEEEG